jgi:hypothetical protein
LGAAETPRPALFSFGVLTMTTTGALTRLLAIGALALAVSLPLPVSAQTTAPAPHRTPMHPSALTLGSHRGRPHHQGVGRLGNHRGRQLHTSPVHGTMAGPRM